MAGTHASPTFDSISELRDDNTPEAMKLVVSRLGKSLQPPTKPRPIRWQRSRSRSRSIGKRFQQEALARTPDKEVARFSNTGLSTVCHSPGAHTEPSVAQDCFSAGNLSQTERARKAGAGCASVCCVLTARGAGLSLTCSPCCDTPVSRLHC